MSKVLNQGDGYRISKRSLLSVSELRSWFQKDIRRGNVSGVLGIVAELILNGHGGSVADRLMVFIAEDIGVASPGLLEFVMVEVEKWHKKVKDRKIRMSELSGSIDLCRELFAIAKTVASPTWKRSRGLALCASQSLRLIDDGLKPEGKFMSSLYAMSKAWVNDDNKTIMALMRGSKFKFAFMKTGKNRLIHAYAAASKYLRLVPIKGIRLADFSEDEAKAILLPSATIGPVPDYAKDKHVLSGQAKGRGMEHFFRVGAYVVNELALGDHPLEMIEPIVQGKQYYFDLEKTYGTASSRSKGVKARLAPQKSKPKGKSKRKARTEDEIEERQKKLRIYFESKSPPILKGAEWCQRVTGSAKVPVMICGEEIWKGPFGPGAPLEVSVRRHELIKKALPYQFNGFRIEEYKSSRFLVMDRVPNTINPFGKGFQFPKDDPSLEKLIVSLVMASAAKLCLTSPSLGDLVPRNMLYDPVTHLFYPIDLEDTTGEHEVGDDLSLVLFRKGKAYGVRKDIRLVLEGLLKKYRVAILSAISSVPFIEDVMWDNERMEHIKRLLK